MAPDPPPGSSCFLGREASLLVRSSAYLAGMLDWKRDVEPVLRVAYGLMDEHGTDDVDGEQVAVALGKDPEDERTARILTTAGAHGWVDTYVETFTSPPHVRATEKGLQRFMRWPVPGQVDVGALFALLEERARDPGLPEEERGRWRELARSARATAEAGLANVLSAWVTQQTGLG